MSEESLKPDVLAFLLTEKQAMDLLTELFRIFDMITNNTSIHYDGIKDLYPETSDLYETISKSIIKYQKQ